MEKKNKEEKTPIVESFGRIVTYLYLVAVLGIFPVYYRGTLFEINNTKRELFVSYAGIFLCLMLIPFLWSIVVFIKEQRRFQIDSSDLFTLILLVAIIVSTFTALDRNEAIHGELSGKVGGIIMLLALLSCFMIKRYARYNAVLIWVNLFSSGFIMLSGILTTCKINFLWMQTGIAEAEKGIFVSPLGNIDYNIPYISLILPGMMGMYLICREIFTKRVLMLYLYLGFINIICLRVESSIVTFGFVFVILLYFALEQTRRLERYMQVVQIFIASNVTVYILKILLKEHIYAFSGLSGFLLNTWVVLLEAVVFLLMIFLQRLNRYPGEKQLVLLHKRYGISLLVLLAVGIVFLVILNVFFRGQAAGTVFGHLILDDSTFSGRGYAYIRTVKEFFKLPLLNQIFGIGLSCFYFFFAREYRAEMLANTGTVFYNPHNDFLSALTSMGIVGAIGFFGLIISAIIFALKKRKEREMQIITVLSLSAYLVQGLVNSYTIFCIPVLFAVLGMAYAQPWREE